MDDFDGTTALARLAAMTFSRRTLIRGTSASVLGLAMAQTGIFTAAAAESTSVQRILDITATVERFGVTFLGAGIQAAEQHMFDKPVPPAVLAILKAARAQEFFHLKFFERAGGHPFVRTFTIPPDNLTQYNTFFRSVVIEETAEIATQLAAIATYGKLHLPALVKVSFQYAAEEAEHRVLANSALGVVPANDNAFEPMLFDDVPDMIESLKERGFINGKGRPFTYPGPGQIDASNVTNRTPGGPRARGACR